MKKALFVSYVFPPIGGAGVQRIIKFVKYLPSFGWTPVVVTVANPSVPILDNSFEKDIPEGIEIIKTKTLEPSYQVKIATNSSQIVNRSVIGVLKSYLKKLARLILLPDPQVLWWPFTIVKLYQYLRCNKVDVIFSSGPPFSTLVMAVFIGKRFHIPVVTDFRDEWSFSRNNWENLPKFNFIKMIDSKLEKYVITNSDVVTVASPGYQKAFNQKYPGKEICTITNGFDWDDFTEFQKSGCERETGAINIVYAGTVWSATSLRPFVAGLERALAGNPHLQTAVKFTVIGRIVPEEEEYLINFPYQDVVQLVGYIDHTEVIDWLKRADILILSLSASVGADKIIPGKIFEYMVSRAAVLAIVPDGECASIANSITGFYVVDPNDIVAITEQIISLCDAAFEVGLTEKSGIENFDRRVLTSKLANTFNGLKS